MLGAEKLFQSEPATSSTIPVNNTGCEPENSSLAPKMANAPLKLNRKGP